MPGAPPVLLLLLMMLMLCAMARGSKPCPPRCVCHDFSDLVDCQHRDLTHIPHGISHGTWLLDLSGNKLTEVRSSSFSGHWSLKVLLLSNNSLLDLQPQALSSLEFLERLDLSYNHLRSLPQDFSRRLTSLLDLRLDHNLLKHLQPPSFDDLESLKKLDLSYNRIAALDAGVFRGLPRLLHLKLEGNKLTELSDGLLAHQHGLEILALGFNNISVIEDEALVPLRGLTLLELQGNQLEHLKFKTFLSLHTAATTHLQLSLNPWTCDCDLHRFFSKILRIRYLTVDDYEEIVCSAPPQQAGVLLASMDSQLCIAETATVLCITTAVLLAVMSALVIAERNRKKSKHNMNESPNETQEK